MTALDAKAALYAEGIAEVSDYLLERGISREVAEAYGLGFVTGSASYAGRLSIPYRTPSGVVALKYRCIAHPDHRAVDGCQKYLTEPGSGTHLYNAQVLRTADFVVVCEGELDAICVDAYCGVAAVAYPGTQTWDAKPYWPLCFEGVPEVVVLADGDKPGRDAARRVVRSIGANARVVEMPDGEDANSWMLRIGPEEFTRGLYE